MGERRETRAAFTDISNIIGPETSPADEELLKREERNRKQREYRARKRAEESIEQREERNRKQREYRARKIELTTSTTPRHASYDVHPISGCTIVKMTDAIYSTLAPSRSDHLHDIEEEGWDIGEALTNFETMQFLGEECAFQSYRVNDDCTGHGAADDPYDFVYHNLPERHHVLKKLIGSPDDSSLGFLRSDNARRYMRQLPQYPRQDFRLRFCNMSPGAVDLLERMLVFDPSRRITVDEALHHPYLTSLHDINEEPTCPSHFSFDFEQPSFTEQLIWRESLGFNPDPPY